MKKLVSFALSLIILMTTVGIGFKPWLSASADPAPADLMLTGAVTLIARNSNKVSVTATDREGVYRLRNTDAELIYNEIRFYFSDLQPLIGYKYAFVEYKNPAVTAWSVWLEDKKTDGAPTSICTGFTPMPGSEGLSQIKNVDGGLLPAEITRPSYYIAVEPGADIEVSFWFSNDPDFRTPKPDLLLTGDIRTTAYDSPITTAEKTSEDGVYKIKANGVTGAIQIGFNDFPQISGYKYCFIDYKNLGSGKVYGVYMAGYTGAYTVFPAVQSGQCKVTTVSTPGQADPTLFPAVISNPLFSINCASDVEVEMSFWFTNNPDFECKPLRQITTGGFQELLEYSNGSTSASGTAVPGVYKVTNGSNKSAGDAYLGFKPQLNVSEYKYLYMDYSDSPGNIAFRTQGNTGGTICEVLPIPAGSGFMKMNVTALPALVNNLLFYVYDDNNVYQNDYEMTVSFYLSNDPDLATQNISSNAELSGLTVNGLVIEGFDPEIDTYNLTVPNAKTSVKLGATAYHPMASVDGETGIVNLSKGINTFEFEVTAKDGITKKTYTININRQTNVTLSTLSASSGTLSPAFDPEITDYTVSVEHSVTEITLTAAAVDAPDATVSGGGVKSLAYGDNNFSVTVEAANGPESKTYNVKVIRPMSATDLLPLLEKILLKKSLSAQEEALVLANAGTLDISIIELLETKERSLSE